MQKKFRILMYVTMLLLLPAAGANAMTEVVHECHSDVITEFVDVSAEDLLIQDGVLYFHTGTECLPVFQIFQSDSGLYILARREPTHCANGHVRACFTCKGCRIPDCGFFCRCLR